jgi:flagellar FliJ protein
MPCSRFQDSGGAPPGAVQLDVEAALRLPVAIPQSRDRRYLGPMPYRFPLQALLRYRESYERRELLRLEIVSRELAAARERTELAKRDREKGLRDLASRLVAGMTASELRFELASDRTRASRIAVCQEEARKLEISRRRQLDAYLKAQQQRKILENLRDRQFASYKLVQKRREQQQLGERFLILHGNQGLR